MYFQGDRPSTTIQSCLQPGQENRPSNLLTCYVWTHAEVFAFEIRLINTTAIVIVLHIFFFFYSLSPHTPHVADSCVAVVVVVDVWNIV